MSWTIQVWMFNVLLQKISSPTSLLSEGLAIAPGFNALLVGPDDCVSIRWRLNHSSRMPRNRRRRICRLSAWSCALVFPFKIPFTNQWSSKPSGASRNCRRFNSRGRQTRGCYSLRRAITQTNGVGWSESEVNDQSNLVELAGGA